MFIFGCICAHNPLDMPADRAVGRPDDKKQPLARRAQMPQPPALHHPAAMHAIPGKEHVPFVPPELRDHKPLTDQTEAPASEIPPPDSARRKCFRATSCARNRRASHVRAPVGPRREQRTPVLKPRCALVTDIDKPKPTFHESRMRAPFPGSASGQPRSRRGKTLGVAAILMISAVLQAQETPAPLPIA